MDNLRNATPDDVRAFHNNSDADSGPLSLHHTLGPRPYQAAAGDHNHDKVYVKKAGQSQIWQANVKQQGGAAIAHTPQWYRYTKVDNIVVYHLVVTINATVANNIEFDLPVPFVSAPGATLAVGSGRENAVTGNLLTVISSGATKGIILCAPGAGSTATLNWLLSVTGTYAVDQVP